MSMGTGKAVRLVDDRVRVITSPARAATDAVTEPTPTLLTAAARDPVKSVGVATCKDVLLWLATVDNERLSTCALVRVALLPLC